jgi:hypothetical protein
VLEEPRIAPSPFPKPRPRRPRVLPPLAGFVRCAAPSQAARGPQTNTTLVAHRGSPARSWRASRSRRHRSSMCQKVLWRGLGPRSAILQSAGLASRRSFDLRQPADSIAQSMADFRRGLPKMGRTPTAAGVKSAAEYLKSTPWIRVEAPWFPKSLGKHAGGGRRGEGADRPAHLREHSEPRLTRVDPFDGRRSSALRMTGQIDRSRFDR